MLLKKREKFIKEYNELISAWLLQELPSIGSSEHMLEQSSEIIRTRTIHSLNAWKEKGII